MPRAAQAMLAMLIVLVIAIVGVLLGFLDGPATPSSAADPSLTPPALDVSPSPSVIVPGAASPTAEATAVAAISPTQAPSAAPTSAPTAPPSEAPTSPPTAPPTTAPTATPAVAPTASAGPTRPPRSAIAGDDFSNPIQISSVPYSGSLDASAATSAAGDPDCYGAHRSVWFAFTAAQTTELAASTLGSSYDTTLYVGRSGPGGRLQAIDCNDDAAGSGQSVVRFTAEAGARYYFMAGAYSPTAGSGDLVFSLESPPPPISISISISGDASFDEDGVLTISGTVTCSARTSNAQVSAEVKQRVGRQVFQGWGETEMSRCGPRARAWQMLVDAHNGTFGEERAQVQASAYACGPYDCANAHLAADVYPVPGFAPPVTPSPPPPPAGSDGTEGSVGSDGADE
jgi:hypothetical protein